MAFAATPPPEVPALDLGAVKEETASALQDHQHVVARRTDRLLAGLILLQWLGTLIVTVLHRSDWAGDSPADASAVLGAWVAGRSWPCFPAFSH